MSWFLNPFPNYKCVCIEKLDECNYYTWKEDIVVCLRLNGLVSAIESDLTLLEDSDPQDNNQDNDENNNSEPETNPKQPSNLVLNAQARAILRSHISEPFQKLMYKHLSKSTYIVWQGIVHHFESYLRNPLQAARLQHSILQIRFTNIHEIRKSITELKNLIGRLRIASPDTTDEQILGYYLHCCEYSIDEFYVIAVNAEMQLHRGEKIVVKEIEDSILRIADSGVAREEYRLNKEMEEAKQQMNINNRKSYHQKSNNRIGQRNRGGFRG